MFEKVQRELLANPKTWLVTGVAGFIGSNLLETLLKFNQKVIGLDNFITGKKENLNQVKELVSESQWSSFKFIEGDVCNTSVCHEATKGVDYVLHQAALGSVPRSIENPVRTDRINVGGTLNIFLASRDQNVKRVVYASSSSVYGDEEELPKKEEKVGRPLSPYAVSKAVNEMYAHVFAKAYNMEIIGLRYFNVFGPRQDPMGAYAAVIPKWFHAMLKNEPITIFGDGKTSRDFCFVNNVVQANILAAVSQHPEAINRVYNIALHHKTSLNELYDLIATQIKKNVPHFIMQKPVYEDFRPGDVRHSLADVTKAKNLLGYQPGIMIGEGLELSFDYYKSIA